MGLNVSALADFNNEVAGELIVKSVYEGQTTSILPVKEGIKHQEPLNLFDVDLVVQGGTCVSTPSGSMIASQRDITVTPRTSHDGLCLKDLDTKYLGISSLEAGSYNETFALANAYGELLINQFAKKNDEFLWNTVDGLGALTSGSTAGVVVAGTGSYAADPLAVLDEMIEAVPSDVADRDDLTIWMSVSNFRKYTNALRQANNFYFDPAAIENRGGILSMAYPFQNVKVVGTAGLQGSERIVIMPDAYAVVGTDLLSDFTEFQLWYDINSDQLKHRISTKLGVQVAYPEYIVSNDKN